jgi:hypothetical protein
MKQHTQDKLWAMVSGPFGTKIPSGLSKLEITLMLGHKQLDYSLLDSRPNTTCGP